MEAYRKRLFVAPFWLLLPTFNVYAEDIRFITEPRSKADTMKYSTDTESELTRELLQRLKLPDNIEIYPWSRGYSMLQKGPNIALFPTTRTKEREDDAKWVGPILKVSWVLYANKASTIELYDLEDAMKVERICGYLGDAKLAFLKGNGFKNLVTRYRSSECAELLINNRVDLWIATDSALFHHAETFPNLINQIKTAYSINTQYLYYALSKEISDQKVEQLQNTLNQMKLDGTFHKLYSGHYSESMIQEISKIEPPLLPWLMHAEK